MKIVKCVKVGIGFGQKCFFIFLLKGKINQKSANFCENQQNFEKTCQIYLSKNFQNIFQAIILNENKFSQKTKNNFLKNFTKMRNKHFSCKP